MIFESSAKISMIPAGGPVQRVLYERVVGAEQLTFPERGARAGEQP